MAALRLLLRFEGLHQRGHGHRTGLGQTVGSGQTGLLHLVAQRLAQYGHRGCTHRAQCVGRVETHRLLPVAQPGRQPLERRDRRRTLEAQSAACLQPHRRIGSVQLTYQLGYRSAIAPTQRSTTGVPVPMPRREKGPVLRLPGSTLSIPGWFSRLPHPHELELHHITGIIGLVRHRPVPEIEMHQGH